ncbi:MAG TPA: hypothetical protein VNN79_23905 [Actinomycetota bacterium]|nr:hypothetical protein [Actinomycetota bacterium]
MLIDLFQLETAVEGGGEGGAPAEAVAEAPEAEATTPVEEAAAPEEARTYSQDEFDQAVRQVAFDAAEEANAMLEARLARFNGNTPIPGATPGPMSGHPGLPAIPELDPFDPDSVNAYNEAREAHMLARFEQMLDQKVGPVTQTFEQQQHAETLARGEEALRDIVSDAVSAGEDITEESKGIAETLATSLFPVFAERYGPDSPRAAEAAIYHAVDTLRQIEKAAEARGAAKQANSLATLAGANGEPAAGQGIAVEGHPLQPLSPSEIARKYTTA